MSITAFAVALLAEGVDRNTIINHILLLDEHVALLAEGVDRNPPLMKNIWVKEPSPSSRRAWIEISLLNKRKHTETGRPPRGGRG